METYGCSTLPPGPPCACWCGDLLIAGDDVFVTAEAIYCSEGCRDEAAAHDDGLDGAANSLGIELVTPD